MPVPVPGTQKGGRDDAVFPPAATRLGEMHMPEKSLHKHTMSSCHCLRQLNGVGRASSHSWLVGR
jgi:hypothetical protein